MVNDVQLESFSIITQEYISKPLWTKSAFNLYRYLFPYYPCMTLYDQRNVVVDAIHSKGRYVGLF